jgi:NAD+ kinase
MARVGIVVHPERTRGRELAVAAASWLQGQGHEVRVPASDAAALTELASLGVPDDDLADGLDFIVSIGGDGTMLRTARLVSGKGTPILGINVGHLGYLTQVQPGEWQPALERVLDGAYRVEERMTLEVTAPSVTGTAVNDAVIEKHAAGHTIRVAVSISGQRAISYAADALIVATPTGSTAYNLSAGGPVVSPGLEAVIVTPVAAHSLFGRPLVVAGHEVVRVEVLSGAAVLGVDGRLWCSLAEGAVIECRASPTPVRLVTFADRDFWRVITAKFGLDPH